jgi:hypothetical protein
VEHHANNVISLSQRRLLSDELVAAARWVNDRDRRPPARRRRHAVQRPAFARLATPPDAAA